MLYLSLYFSNAIVGVGIGVSVGVGVGVTVGVCVGVKVTVDVAVAVGVLVGVFEQFRLKAGLSGESAFQIALELIPIRRSPHDGNNANEVFFQLWMPNIGS